MNRTGKEAIYRLPRFAFSIALALVFWGGATFLSPIFASLSEVGGFLTWVTLMLVGGIFLIRALFDAIVMGDKAIAWFLQRLGVKERWSLRRVSRDVAYILIIMLTAAAVVPFSHTFSNVGNALHTLVTYVTLGAILLFIYDIGRTIYRIMETKLNMVAEWLDEKHNTLE